MLALTLGAVVAVAAGADVARHEPGGWTGVAVGLVLALAASALLIRVMRTYARVEQADRRELRTRGGDDGLPLGVFREGQWVGLEASDRLLVLAGFSAAAGAVIVAATIADSRVGWQFGLSFSLVWFVPALFLLRLGTGVAYWLAPDGVLRRRRRHVAVRWDDVERVIPMYRGAWVLIDTGASSSGAAPWE